MLSFSFLRRRALAAKVSAMLTELLGAADWTIPPSEMELTATYGALLGDIATLVSDLSVNAASSAQPSDDWRPNLEKAISLYTKCPGIVNVMLNYKICVEHDLPLHPTVYYELKEARKYRIDYGLPVVVKANQLYLHSIDLARSALRLNTEFAERAASFLAELPSELRSFVYTGIRDSYTWRGSDPRLLFRLAEKISSEYSPDIIVAAAHGSIMPALLLAEIMNLPLYFIRFSMFKRADEEPIVTFSDEAWLYTYKEKSALLFDEDVAGGRTLTIFSERLRPFFAYTKTACSIRHAGAAIKPDFCAKVWWD
jgi:hypothetical protein